MGGSVLGRPADSSRRARQDLSHAKNFACIMPSVARIVPTETLRPPRLGQLRRPFSKLFAVDGGRHLTETATTPAPGSHRPGSLTVTKDLLDSHSPGSLTMTRLAPDSSSVGQMITGRT